MFLSLWAAVTTFLVPLPLLLLLSFGMTAQLPMKSLFWLRTRQVQGNSPGLALSVLKTASRSREVPSAALLPRVHHPLVATVPHTFELASSLSWGNARPTESGVVDRGIVAASLLTKRASVQGLSVSVGIGSVHDPQPKAVLGLLGPLGSLLPQRLHPWIDQSAANKVIVVVDVTTKGVAALLVLWNAAALAEAAGELPSTWNSAGRGLAAAVLGEGARLASTSTSLGQT